MSFFLRNSLASAPQGACFGSDGFGCRTLLRLTRFSTPARLRTIKVSAVMMRDTVASASPIALVFVAVWL